MSDTEREPRPRRTITTYGPARGRVRVLVHGDLVRVQWYDAGVRRVKSWPNTADGRTEAKAWAEGFAEERTHGARRAPVPRLTLRELWERYTTAELPHLRLKTLNHYRAAWNKWELFLGAEFVAADARAEHLDRFRVALPKLAVGHVQRIVRVVKGVFAWGRNRELLEENRLATYRFKVPRDDRPVPPPEYAAAERQAILAALHPDRAGEWRPWAAVQIAAHQGARLRAILHLQRGDVDLEGGRLIWRARWDKVGREWEQPLTAGARAALETALTWAARDGYSGPWIFYSTHHRKRRMGDDPAAVYHPTSLERALRLAEDRAGVEHRPYRAMHGFRRAVAGDVWAATGDAMLALNFIGDTDPRRAREYLQRRDERLRTAAAVMDRANRHPTVTEADEAAEGDSELVAAGMVGELPRQDSNLRPAG